MRALDGDGDAARGCDIGAIEFYPVVNEWVQLDRVHATIVPPSATQTVVNPLAAGGTYTSTRRSPTSAGRTSATWRSR